MVGGLVVIATVLGAVSGVRSSLRVRTGSRMCAGPPVERNAAPRRAMLRDAAGLALGAALGAGGAPLPSLAAAKGIRASSQGSQVNKDPQSLLRLGLPIDCPAARAVQQDLEELRGNALKSLWSKVRAAVHDAHARPATQPDGLSRRVAPPTHPHARPRASRAGCVERKVCAQQPRLQAVRAARGRRGQE